MDSNTELFPELWLPITTMLGSFRVSLWSMLSNTDRISINFLVRCIKLLLSPPNSSLFSLESDGDDRVAATNAATAAASSGDRSFGDLGASWEPDPLLSLSLPDEPEENRFLRN